MAVGQDNGTIVYGGFLLRLVLSADNFSIRYEFVELFRLVKPRSNKGVKMISNQIFAGIARILAPASLAIGLAACTENQARPVASATTGEPRIAAPAVRSAAGLNPSFVREWTAINAQNNIGVAISAEGSAFFRYMREAPLIAFFVRMEGDAALFQGATARGNTPRTFLCRIQERSGAPDDLVCQVTTSGQPSHQVRFRAGAA